MNKEEARVEFMRNAKKHLKRRSEKLLAEEASQAKIQVDCLPSSTDFTDSTAYADYYRREFERRKMIGWVAQKLKSSQPDEVLEFSLMAGTNEKGRNFAAMIDNLNGLSSTPFSKRRV